MKRVLFFFAGLGLITGLGLSCRKNTTGFIPPAVPADLTHVLTRHSGCGAEPRLARTLGSRAELADVSLARDTLTLTVKYESLCCAEWEDSVKASGPDVFLLVMDTVHACRCECRYMTDFLFLYRNPEGQPLHVRFGTWGPGHATYDMTLDTLVRVPQN